jgi:hypothetical protein
VAAVDALLAQRPTLQDFDRHAGPLLASMSWDSVFDGMHQRMMRAARSRQRSTASQPETATVGAAS